MRMATAVIELIDPIQLTTRHYVWHLREVLAVWIVRPILHFQSKLRQNKQILVLLSHGHEEQTFNTTLVTLKRYLQICNGGYMETIISITIIESR